MARATLKKLVLRSKSAKSSPDSFVQMLIQLAYYRMHKQITPVYETASTRMFHHGRTETGRSLSVQSKEFVEAFDNDSIIVT